MEDRIEQMGFTMGIKNSSWFTPHPKAQLLFRLQTFEPSGHAKVSPINTKADITATFHGLSKPNKNFVIYWPLCYGSAIYLDPEAFKRLLAGVIKKLKWPAPHKVHFIFVDTGELHRHNLGKNLSPVSTLVQLKSPSPSHSPRSSPRSELKASLDSPREIPVTQLNETKRREGIELGREMTKALRLEQVAGELNCIIDLIAWGEVKDPHAFRALIKRLVKNSSEDPPNLTKLWPGNDIHNLSLFVANQYSENESETEPTTPTFTQAVSPLLQAQSERDLEKQGDKFNIKKSHKAAKLYLFEEEGHMMLVNISISDLIDAVIQPEIMGTTRPSPRNRKFYVGEKLNEWVVKLTAKRLGLSFAETPSTYRYVTIEVPRNFITQHEEKAFSSQKTKEQESPPVITSPQLDTSQHANFTLAHPHSYRQRSVSHGSFFGGEASLKIPRLGKKIGDPDSADTIEEAGKNRNDDLSC